MRRTNRLPTDPTLTLQFLVQSCGECVCFVRNFVFFNRSAIGRISRNQCSHGLLGCFDQEFTLLLEGINSHFLISLSASSRSGRFGAYCVSKPRRYRFPLQVVLAAQFYNPLQPRMVCRTGVN